MRRNFGSNQSVLSFDDGREVLVSYATPVAAFVPGRGYVKRVTKYSVTTSRHVNAWTEGRATEVSDDEFKKLVAPLEA